MKIKGLTISIQAIFVLAMAAGLSSCKLTDDQIKGKISSDAPSGDNNTSDPTPPSPPASGHGFEKSNAWTWVNNSNLKNQSGIYGSQGVPSTSNEPGSRNDFAMWTDASDNIWIFGGRGYDEAGTLGRLNDVWKYNVSDKTWTWVKGSKIADPGGNWGSVGVEADSNTPGGRSFMQNTSDQNGNLFFYGGAGKDITDTDGWMADLWVFNTTTLKWTWLGGANTIAQAANYGSIGVEAASNDPGQIVGGFAWVDKSNGNFWMFGGKVNPASWFSWTSHMWRFNASNGYWTWFGDSPSGNGSGVYGTQGVPSTGNSPGSRYGGAWGTHPDGSFYLFGGEGKDDTGSEWVLGDLWKFNPATLEWTWLSGPKVRGQVGVYGTKGVSDAANYPSCRTAGGATVDKDGNFWLLGGYGKSSLTSDVGLNDLWKYSHTTGEWTWMSGSDTGNTSNAAIGDWGTLGVTNANNEISRRDIHNFTSLSDGSIWVFGGGGCIDSTPSSGRCSDLWIFY